MIKPIASTIGPDTISIMPLMILFLFTVYPLYFVWLRAKKFSFERSMIMKFYASRNMAELNQEQKSPTHSKVTIWFKNAIKPFRLINSKTRNQIYFQLNQNPSEPGIPLRILTAGIAHEINNPLNYVKTSTYNLKRDLEKFKDFLFDLAGEDTGKEIMDAFNNRFYSLFNHVNTIEEGTQRIQGIISNLNSFSRGNPSGIAPVNLQEGIEATLNMVKTIFKQHVDFVTDYKTDLQIEGNENQLKQVFINIIINACHAIMEKQNKSGDTTKGKLIIQTLKERDYAAVSFRDNGIGMPEEVKRRMFEPFFTTKANNNGTGLGLSISSEIVQKYGGHIEVKSKQGEGTAIIIYFPLTKGQKSIVKEKSIKEHILC